MLTLLAEVTTGTIGATESMDMASMMDVLLIAMYIGCGIYSIYSYVMQKKSRAVLNNKIICPGNCEPKQCKEPDAFLKFILPRTLGFGIGLLVFGVLFILDHFFSAGNPWSAILLVVLPMAMIFWYVAMLRQAEKRYW